MNQSTSPIKKEDSDLDFMEQFRYINGRRYHNVENVSYFLPNDNEEADRLSMQHYLAKHIWNGNFSSPVEEKLRSGRANVLDIGLAFFSFFNPTSILESNFEICSRPSVDVSNMWNNLENTPPNAGFLVHNLIQGVPFPERIMDFIHVRFMGLSFGELHWIKLINELIRVCKPGGWIEIMNLDYTPKNMGPATRLLMNSLVEFHKSKGCSIPSAKDFERYLRHNDRVTAIRTERKSTPLGNWSEKVGDIALLGFDCLFKAFKVFLAPYMNLDDKQYQKLLKEHDRQVNEYKTSFQTYRIYGRKSASIDKRSVKQVVEEIYSLIHPTIHPLDASDRVLVAIIKALIAIKNEPTNPRQLAACIQKYGFTTLGGSTPYATVSGHISTHFTRVRQKVVPRPILGKIHHPTLKNKINYYLLDSDNVLRDLLAQHFPSPSGVPSSSSSPYATITSTIIPTVHPQQHRQPISPPTSRASSPQSSNYKESEVIAESQRQTSVVESSCQSAEDITSCRHYLYAGSPISSPPIQEKILVYTNKPSEGGVRTFMTDDDTENDQSVSQEQKIQQMTNNENLMCTMYGVNEMEITPTSSSEELVPLSGKKRRASENGDAIRSRNMPRPTPAFLTNVNGLEVFVTNISVNGNEVRLMRRVDTNCVDRWSLLSAGGRKPRNGDKRWWVVDLSVSGDFVITLEDAQSLAAKLDIEQSLGIFLDPRLYDYFDVDLDLPTTSGACCGPLSGFAYWFQCVNPKKIFLG
ncbi:317_t:CDS:2 [Acaulospora colombiana]|uniref:317_t:CDS:1 n=1 Tax=Acaulospora colombiana TaxID=27376 RepID=A0ACA9KT44_9GLOM|nr:317_t:CDS:2 [Acaulospora colombiana]